MARISVGAAVAVALEPIESGQFSGKVPLMPLSPRISRRTFLGAWVALAAGCYHGPKTVTNEARDALVKIEERLGGRVGVYALATESGATLSYRENERFAMCSTFKWVLVAAVLSSVERGELSLEQELTFGERDILEYAPVVRKYRSRGKMTVSELAEAAITLSDNTAANLLLERVGGPPGLTRFLRTHGDENTQLHRFEPMLNTNFDGDWRDSTTPRAMVGTMKKLLLGSVLSPSHRELLIGWMIASPTGAERLRAGLPKGWRVGDKTGTCGKRGAANDVAIAWSPKRAPILIAAYLNGSSKSVSELSAAHAEIGRIIVSRFDFA